MQEITPEVLHNTSMRDKCFQVSCVSNKFRSQVLSAVDGIPSLPAAVVFRVGKTLNYLNLS